jgi:zinc D-Ala-D-Ala carboxypeptidase
MSAINTPTKISPHFTLAELTVTNTGLVNRVPDVLMPNLKRLADALEKIRAMAGSPILVNSAYRSNQVNDRVGGVPTSFHTLALAADIRSNVYSPRTLAFMAAQALEGEFDQIILEFDRWVHVGIPRFGQIPRGDFFQLVKEPTGQVRRLKLVS